MLKFLHKPKKKNLYFFIVVFVLSVLCNLCFTLVSNNIITDNIDFLLVLHLLILFSYLLVAIFCSNYILLCIEKTLSLLENKRYLWVSKVFTVFDIVLGIFLICVFYIYGAPIVAEEYSNNLSSILILLNKSIYFKVLNTTQDLSSVYSFWLFMPMIYTIILSILFFCAAARKTKKRKLVIENIKQKELLKQVDDFLGFEYEQSEFYKQTQIPYFSLNHSDGTRGEFEVYRALVNSDISELEYIFNREIPKEDGLLTEIDLILLHKKGIFVLENKDYDTKIFGKSTDYDLTIIDYKGNKKSVYNPIRQNEKHVFSLKSFLISKGLYIDDNLTPIYSVVIFTDMRSNKSDDIISGIEICDSKTKICTSQNLPIVIKDLLGKNNNSQISVSKTKELLYSLSIRKKF